MIYMDSSALVKLTLREPESEAIAARIVGHKLIASVLARTETIRAVGRRQPGALWEAIATLDQVTFVGISDSLLVDAASVTPASVRSLDAIHVATALRLRSSVHALVSYDTRMLEAAAAYGIPVESPS